MSCDDAAALRKAMQDSLSADIEDCKRARERLFDKAEDGAVGDDGAFGKGTSRGRN